MSKVTSAITIAALSVVAVSACKQESAAAPVDVRATMQQQVNPATLAIWDIGNNAMNADGGIDPALMTDAKWTKLADSAAQLAAGARALAAGTSYVASAPDNATVADGEIKMSEIQKHLDADPQSLPTYANALAESADKIAAAARTKDAAAAGDVISAIDQVCESCHLVYWYPEQK